MNEDVLVQRQISDRCVAGCRGFAVFFLNVSQNVAMVVFAFGPFFCVVYFSFVSTTRTSENSSQGSLYSMSQWWEENREHPRIVIKERNPWHTSKETCELNELDVEEVTPFRALTRIRVWALGYQTDVTAKANVE